MIKFIVFLSVCIFCFQEVSSSPNKNGRIAGGATSYAGEFPFVVAIYKDTGNGTYFCAGSLITNQWVLTAGQCVINGILFVVRLGSNNLIGDDQTAVTVATERSVLYPYFNPETLANDIGLIKLRKPVTLTNYIRTINYAAGTDPPLGRVVLIAGWGQTDNDQEAEMENVLRWVALTPISNDACRNTYGDQITNNILCAAGDDKQGICKGDIGGPLFRSGIGPTYLDGIASFFSSKGCDSSEPSGFTRIAPYLPWIQEIISTI